MARGLSKPRHWQHKVTAGHWGMSQSRPGCPCLGSDSRGGEGHICSTMGKGWLGCAWASCPLSWTPWHQLRPVKTTTRWPLRQWESTWCRWHHQSGFMPFACLAGHCLVCASQGNEREHTHTCPTCAHTHTHLSLQMPTPNHTRAPGHLCTHLGSYRTRTRATHTRMSTDTAPGSPGCCSNAEEGNTGE